jgi:hypothetical protein
VFNFFKNRANKQAWKETLVEQGADIHWRATQFSERKQDFISNPHTSSQVKAVQLAKLSKQFQPALNDYNNTVAQAKEQSGLSDRQIKKHILKGSVNNALEQKRSRRNG